MARAPEDEYLIGVDLYGRLVGVEQVEGLQDVGVDHLDVHVGPLGRLVGPLPHVGEILSEVAFLGYLADVGTRPLELAQAADPEHNAVIECDQRARRHSKVHRSEANSAVLA